jgi:hypothetical protein
MDPALRDAAAALCLRMLAFKRRVAGEPFDELSAAEQAAIVREMNGELDQAIADYEEQRQPDPSSEVDAALRIVRGPRGRWYVKRGAENVAGPFETEAEAAEVVAGA